MRLTILGSGTCIPKLPGKPLRFPPAFLVEWEKKKILFECSQGVDWRLEKMGHNITSLEHIAISHPHPDHYALVHFLQAAYVKAQHFEHRRSYPLSVYGPKVIADHFLSIWNAHLPERPDELFSVPKVSFTSFTASFSGPKKIGSARLSGFPVWHGWGRTGAVAFRLETKKGVFSYSGDTGDCAGVRKAARNASVFVCESSLRIGDTHGKNGYGHLNPFQAGQIARETGVKKLVLFHYYNVNADRTLVKECRRSGFMGDIILAKDFQKIIF